MNQTLFYCEWDASPVGPEIHTIETLLRDYYKADVFEPTEFMPWVCHSIQPDWKDGDPLGESWGETESFISVIHSLMNPVLTIKEETFFWICENMSIRLATPDDLATIANTRRDLGEIHVKEEEDVNEFTILESVGSAVNRLGWVCPVNSDGTIDESSPVHVDDCTKEWFQKMTVRDSGILLEWTEEQK